MAFTSWRGPTHESHSPFAVRLRASDGVAVDPVRIALAGVHQACGSLHRRPAVAFAGSHFLVAWSAPNSGLCVVRVPASGDIGTLTPIVLSSPNAALHPPAVASDGTNFLVVWSDRTSADPPNTYYAYRARIRASDGMVLDPGGVRLTASAADQRQVAVGFDGSNFLALWRDRRAPAGLYGARIRASDGQVLDADGFLVQASATDDIRGAVAFDGTNYLVAWQENAGVVGVRVRASNRMRCWMAARWCWGRGGAHRR